jgi:rod shape-determining protein MreC
MENFISRYRNVSILVAILFAQVLALAVQVKRSSDNKPTRLVRVWTVSAVTPFEKSIVWLQNGSATLWHEYLYLRGVRQENRDLKAEIERLRLQEVRLKDDAEQARRLQTLLGFKETYISKTLAAQVIGSCGSDKSQCVYIDKGAHDGLVPDMAVITADGIVGKVLRVFSSPSTAQVLLINDQTSGVGVILEKSRLQGILRGSPSGDVVLEKVMSDEQVQPGETVLTSGGDLVFPKGMPVGTVTDVKKGTESFLSIRVKPSSNLAKLEEVLVITKREETAPAATDGAPVRAIDILTQRLPSVPQQAATDPNAPPPPTSGLVIAPAQSGGATSNSGTSKPQLPGNSTAAGVIKPQPQGSAASKPVNGPATGKPAGSVVQPAPRDAFSPPETSKAPVTGANPPMKAPASSGTTVAPKPSASSGVTPGNTKPVVQAAPPKPKPQTPPDQSPTQPPPTEDQPH